MLRRKLLQHARTFHTHPVETPKRPARGQNLSERFRRLEKMVLAKHNLNQTITQSPQVSQPPTLSLPTTSRQSTQTTFRGLVIPEIPKAPEPDGGRAHPATTASFLRTYYRVLHVWLRRLRVRFIPGVTGRLQDCGRLYPCLSHVHGRTRGTMA